MMKNTDKNPLDDKRKYFRVDDIAYLSYRVVSWVNLRLSNKPDSSLSIDTITLKANLDRLSRELQPLHNVINASHSNIAHYLSTLDEKIALLSKYVLRDVEVENDVVPQHVNIGGGGLLFVSDKPVITGAMLELKMKILPEDLAICSYAKVISCVKNDTVYKVAVEFEFMDEDVRDLITRHVLVKEQALINRA